MKIRNVLIPLCCLFVLIATGQQLTAGFNWPGDYREHVAKLRTTDEKIVSLSEAVSDLHNQSMRAQANSHWLQTQIDLIVKFVDNSRPKLDDMNTQLENLRRENADLKGRLTAFQQAACPVLLRASGSPKETEKLKTLCP